jgi:NAD(P)-dependent dehydrogenase (short-subunit alcohol dehydrogenase family)
LCVEAAKESPGTAIGLTCDVTEPAQCEQAIRDTLDGLGDLDDVVYAAGLIAVVALVDADERWWRRTFETNVMGAALITRAALPYLKRSGGTAVYLSSVASLASPWPGLGVYGSSKAALNRMVDAWRAEHPDVGFARINVGPTAGGATTAESHPGVLTHTAGWAKRGLASGTLAPAESIARTVATILSDSSRIWDVTVQPRDGALPWGEG